MKQKLKLSKFQYASRRRRGEGLRIGTTRRPPRGVPKNKWIKEGYFDIWMPVLAPSANLLKRWKDRPFETAKQRDKFFAQYEKELLGKAESRQAVEFVAQVASRISVSIGCFCGEESWCHRSRLFKIIQKHAPSS
jgi:uncharacterized protein YeaO (DUF488 family)